MARVFSWTSKQFPTSESRTLEQFKMLGKRWTVFHSTPWQSIRRDRQGDGEADFILMHPAHGLLVLEVKGGRLEIIEGQWWSVDRHNRRYTVKDPFSQAMESKYSLLRYLAECGVDTRRTPVCHGVVFPDIRKEDRIGWSAPSDIVIDVADLRDPVASVARIFKHWDHAASIPRSVEENIIQLLRPTRTLRLPLGERLESTREHLVRMTGRQKMAFRLFRRNRRALVVGGAGTGKTVLALARAREFAEMGQRTLLTCYNSLLADYLAQAVKSTELVDVRSFHTLCVSEAKRAGVPIPHDPSPSWWETDAPWVLLEALGEERPFEAIVVDEGQDFSGDWIAALLELAGDDATPFYLFADSHQELYERSWDVPDSWPRLDLDLNCRNTHPIAKMVASVYGDKVESLSRAGTIPIVRACDGHVEAAQLVQTIVHRLLTDERVGPEQVAVLSDSRAFVDRLQSKLVGDHPFTSFGGVGVTAETVHRFKGLESDVVVLSLSDSLLAVEDKVRL